MQKNLKMVSSMSVPSSELMLLFCLHSLQFSNGEPVIYANMQKINLHTSKNVSFILKMIIIHK